MHRLAPAIFLPALLVALACPIGAQALPPGPADTPADLWFRLGGSGGDIWLAQECETCGEGRGNANDDKGNRADRYGVHLSASTTADLVEILLDANETCDRRIERRYRIDCLRVYYGWVAEKLPATGEYAPIRKAMLQAEKKLSDIVSANLDKTAPVITPREGHRSKGRKLPPLRAVKPAAEKKALAAAEAVVKEAEIVILRSGEDPARRTAHYEDVAQAVDSNLVVLRSA